LYFLPILLSKFISWPGRGILIFRFLPVFTKNPMKKTLLLFLLYLSSQALAQQITIEQGDMPNVSDTLRISQALPTTGVDLQSTGANHTWNFSTLTPIQQQVQRFIAVSATSIFFQPTFNTEPNRATIASPVLIPDYLQELAGDLNTIQITNPFLFYRATAEAFLEVGFSATIAGLPVPEKYERPDAIYNFPLTFGAEQSSSAFFVIHYPAFQIYYDHTRVRDNKVDGWGNLTTPFGTFPVLRVVSTLKVNDSVRTAEIPAARTQRPVVREYKWLAKNQGIPLLQITTAEVEGQEVVASITYRDNYRRLTTLSASDPGQATAVVAYPSPLRWEEPLRVALPSSLRGALDLQVFSPTGQQVYREVLTEAQSAAGLLTVPAQAFDRSRGLYLVRIQTSEKLVVKKILRE
jgi:hypothetical protein